jgi:hypothetical protein
LPLALAAALLLTGCARDDRAKPDPGKQGAGADKELGPVLDFDAQSPERTLRWLAGLIERRSATGKDVEFGGAQAWARYNTATAAVRDKAICWPLAVAEVLPDGGVLTEPVAVPTELPAFRLNVRPASAGVGGIPEGLPLPDRAGAVEGAGLRRGDRVIVRGVVRGIQMKAERVLVNREVYLFEVLLDAPALARAKP